MKKIKIIGAIFLIVAGILVMCWYYFGENILTRLNNNDDVSNKQEESDTFKNENSVERENAIDLAYEEFSKIGETMLNKEEFSVIEVTRNEEISYFITSRENSIEIAAKDLSIIRINSVLVPR